MDERQARQQLSMMLITMAAAAAILGIGVGTVKRYIDRGILDAVIIRGSGNRATYRVKSESLRKLLKVELDEGEVANA